MYSDQTKTTLSKRIRWNDSMDSDFAVELNLLNSTGDSGKHFQSFHNLVSIDNIYLAGVPEVDMDEAAFNDILTDMRMQGTLRAISDIMDDSDGYIAETDYSELMAANAGVFDKAIGYSVAISVLEMLLSSKRITPEERNAKLSAANLKLELEGFDNGSSKVKGIRFFYREAVRKASAKLFPKTPTVQAGPAW